MTEFFSDRNVIKYTPEESEEISIELDTELFNFISCFPAISTIEIPEIKKSNFT